jgi:hypothetical protein
MKRLHRTVGVLSGSAKLDVLRESTGRAIRPHIASRNPNVPSINRHKRFIVAESAERGALHDRDKLESRTYSGDRHGRGALFLTRHATQLSMAAMRRRTRTDPQCPHP